MGVPVITVHTVGLVDAGGGTRWASGAAGSCRWILSLGDLWPADPDPSGTTGSANE